MFGTGSYHVAQDAPELTVLLPQLPRNMNHNTRGKGTGRSAPAPLLPSAATVAQTQNLADLRFGAFPLSQSSLPLSVAHCLILSTMKFSAYCVHHTLATENRLHQPVHPIMEI